jgi:hypothetical protein
VAAPTPEIELSRRRDNLAAGKCGEVHTFAPAAGWLTPELERCEVGWRRGKCSARPTLVAVKANRSGRWDRPGADVRWVVRPVCRLHADRLADDGWTIYPLD